MNPSPDEAFTSTLRVLNPAPGVLGFYDGRVLGRRLWSAEPNWLDDGAYELGICSYAIVSDCEALVYDTHISVPHARCIRETLAGLGVHTITVVLSHWHDDHIAGNAVFSDCEIVSHRLTREILIEKKRELETGNPPICPLVLPTHTFESELTLQVGQTFVRLHHSDIHSADGVVLLFPDARILLAGDTLEDPLTYVAEPKRLREHLIGLDGLESLAFERVLPNHGSEQVIRAGGYGREILAATRHYVTKLLRCADDPELAMKGYREFLAEDLAAGVLQAFEPYEKVHRMNVEAVLRAEANS